MLVICNPVQDIMLVVCSKHYKTSGWWSVIQYKTLCRWSVSQYVLICNIWFKTNIRITHTNGFPLIPNCCWSLLYSAILRSRADSLRSHVILHEWIAFDSVFLNIHRSGVLTALAWLVPRETAAVSAQVLCTPYNHAPWHFMQSHIRKVYACLAVTCTLGRMTGIFYMLLW